MELSNDVVSYLEVLLNVAFVVLPTLAALALATPTGKYIAMSFIALWKWFRPNVDEADDSLVVSLAKLSGRKPEEVITILTTNMDKLANILKEAQPQGG